MKKLAVLAAAIMVGTSALAFQAGQSTREIDNEVKTRVGRGESDVSVARAAKSAQITSSVMYMALKLNGRSHAEVVGALVAAGYFPPDVVNFAVNGGADRAEMNQVAINNNADPSSLTSAPGAGGNSGLASNTFQGFNPGSYSSSRSSTFTGSGKKCQSVSCS
jgi:hypothetical protein